LSVLFLSSCRRLCRRRPFLPGTSLVVPPCWPACIRFWRGRQSVDAKYWKFLYVVFVCSQVGAGQGNTTPWLGSNVMSACGIRWWTKVSFRNKLSFPRFYIFLNFTFIINDPFRKLNSGFNCVSLLASALEEGWTKNL
jgi:hypothetical protein